MSYSYSIPMTDEMWDAVGLDKNTVISLINKHIFRIGSRRTLALRMKVTPKALYCFQKGEVINLFTVRKMLVYLYKHGETRLERFLQEKQ